MLAGIGPMAGCVSMFLQTKFAAMTLENGSCGTDPDYSARNNYATIKIRAGRQDRRPRPRSEDDAFLS
jgi:hypothetical protein